MAIVELASEDVSVSIPHVPKEMISVSDTGGKTRVRINFSSMDVIQNCLRKAKFLLVDKWKPETESVATVFGSAVHKALEVYYSGAPEERKMVSLDDLSMMALGPGGMFSNSSNLLMRSVAAFAEKAAPLAQLPDSDNHSLVNGAWILHCYFKTFIDDPWVTFVDKDGPFVERVFSLVIHEDADLIVEIFGTIDFAFRHIHTGEIMPGDHKTAGFLNFGGSSYFDREKPNHQYTGYLMGFREVFGHDTNRFLANIIEKKARPKTPQAKGVSFPRQITERNEDDFTEFREAMMHTVRLFLEARRTGVWSMGPIGACTAYGSCQYRQVCSVPRAMRETLLKAKFIQGEKTT